MVDLAMANVVVLNRDNKFEEFWTLYPSPRRTGKAICRSKWEAITGPTGLRTRTKDRDAECFIVLTLSAAPEAIIEGLKRALCQWHNPTLTSWDGRTESQLRFPKWKDDAKFIPMPSTWLNQGRWED